MMQEIKKLGKEIFDKNQSKLEAYAKEKLVMKEKTDVLIAAFKKKHEKEVLEIFHTLDYLYGLYKYSDSVSNDIIDVILRDAEFEIRSKDAAYIENGFNQHDYSVYVDHIRYANCVIQHCASRYSTPESISIGFVDEVLDLNETKTKAEYDKNEEVYTKVYNTLQIFLNDDENDLRSYKSILPRTLKALQEYKAKEEQNEQSN